MKNLKLLVAVLFATVSLNSCILDDDNIFGCERGQGPVVTRVLDLEPFTSINLQFSDDVVIKQGPEQFVEVEGQENMIDELRLNVSNNNWNIRYEDCVSRHEKLTIYITIPDIESLHLSGSGDITGDGLLSGDNIDLRISGSGDMKLDLDYDQVKAKIDGSGDMDLDGECQELDLTISGSGDFHAFGMESQFCDVNISGSGNTEVWVTDELDVTISGSGDVYYIGNPSIDVSISGSGKLKDAN